ncbi:putative toxin-antitoxin system toxin component, PIN family [Candidatus Margulisiibacteriota bacterium]
MKIVLLDTNIYISAILFGGNLKKIINLARQKKFQIIISEYIIWEIREALSRKFKIPESKLNQIEYDILSLAKVIKVTSIVSLIAKDPVDNEILACAKDGKADCIVTGDKLILSINKYMGIEILSPSKFLGIIEH